MPNMADCQIHVGPATVPLRGTLVVPPDKSIAHRALFFAALNRGRTTIHNPSLAADPQSTLRLLGALGYDFERRATSLVRDGARRVPHAPELLLDCGNSGTTARLAAGFLAGEHGRFTLVGDASLAARPMERVAAPLRVLGLPVATADGHMPITIDAGAAIDADMRVVDVRSAQVHGALFLAALRSSGGLRLRRTEAMRDHTVRMARAFGLEIAGEQSNGMPVDVVRNAGLEWDVELTIPGDPSSAAFLVAAAVLAPGSSVRIEGVGLNPTRTAFFALLRAMGADIRWEISTPAHEPIGWIEANYSPDLRGVDVREFDPDGAHVPLMMDELPLVALVAARAMGTTAVHGAAELRVKESDRIAATAELLRAVGVQVGEHADGFSVSGPQPIRGDAVVNHHGDHRLGMLAAVAGLAAERPVRIPDAGVAAVSYPEFWGHLRLLGADIVEEA